ncbi:MAG: ABC transporter ATP-binding protein [Proteobacteria bacterium]|nr:ABC transporter ATP-binding protein [Pseudomonadota bacterium]
MLSAKGITIYYGKVLAVKNVSFEVEKGKIVTLIGANGAGKSTILKTISGLKNPATGEILFEGKRIDNLLPQDIVRLGISHVPEGRRLFPSMSTIENLVMGAYLQKNRREIDKELERVFEYFPVLKDRRKQRAGSLSGGEQQMLAIGRALMSKPTLLLLDEPSIGLSPLMSQMIGKIVNTINQEGVSILLVEQNAKLALKLAYKGYVLETGSIVLAGRAGELLEDEAVKTIYLGV